MKQTIKLLVVALLSAAVFAVVKAPTAHAASMTVVSGLDDIANNGQCQLSEAIININDQTQTYPDCAAGDGNNDIINLPIGTITLTDNLPASSLSTKILGAGMGKSIVDGAGLYLTFRNQPSIAQSYEVRDLTIKGFFTGAITSTAGDVDIERVEIDGNGSTFPAGSGTFGAGISINNQLTTTVDIKIKDVYMHDITTDSSTFVGIIATSGDSAGVAEGLNVSIENTTIAHINSSNNIFSIVVGAGMTVATTSNPGTSNVKISNTTIDDINSPGGSAVGITGIALGDASTSAVVDARNNTITNLNGAPNGLLSQNGSAGLAILTGGFQNGLTNTVNFSAENNIIADTGLSCAAFDISTIVAGTDSVGVHNLSSGGGNLAAEGGCESYFTKPTDHINVSGLGTSLNSLADNGGFVPTRALKQGSPAVDSGVTLANLSSDARGAVRPQGLAYDSGAYESPYSRATLAATGVNSQLLFVLSAAGIFSFATMAYALKRTALGKM
jgi:hypothetical protein